MLAMSSRNRGSVAGHQPAKGKSLGGRRRSLDLGNWHRLFDRIEAAAGRSLRFRAASRSTARYTVDRATPNRSPSSALAYSPDFMPRAVLVVRGCCQSVVVDVDPDRGDAQCCQCFALDGEVLFVGGTPGVTDEKRRHDAPPILGRLEANVARSPAAARTRYIQSSGNDHHTQEGKGAF